MNSWFVYILECGDGTLYTGISTDVDRRLREHRKGTASKYTAARGVEGIVYTEEAENRSTASKREAVIKQLSRAQKMKLTKEN